MFVMFTDEIFLGFETLYVLLLQGCGMGRTSWDILHYSFCYNAALSIFVQQHFSESESGSNQWLTSILVEALRQR
jgi:hypothetical protein